MSKVKCIPCLGADIKKVIRGLDDRHLNEALETIPDCSDTLQVEMCVKPPRQRSAYQTFISNCMKTKPIKGKPFGEASKYMKECAVEWRRRKDEIPSEHT